MEDKDFNVEYSVSGSILIDANKEFWPAIESVLSASDFQVDSCRAIYEAAFELLDAGETLKF